MDVTHFPKNEWNDNTILYFYFLELQQYVAYYWKNEASLFCVHLFLYNPGLTLQMILFKLKALNK